MTSLQPRRATVRGVGRRVVAAEQKPDKQKPGAAAAKQWLSTKAPWLTVGTVPLLAVGGFDLDGPLSTAQALATLASIVFVHECGHFFAARLQNIYVTKFAIGFGPTLLSFTGPKDGVEYSLRAFPLGGYVAFPDDDPDSDIDPEDPNLLRNRPIKDRAIVISAGVIANVVFANAILFTQMSTVGLGENVYSQGVIVPELLPVSAAARAGVQPMDIILSVDGESVGKTATSVQFLVNKIKDSPGEELNLHLRRGVKEFDVKVIPDKASDGGGRIGVQLAGNVELTRRKPTSTTEALAMTAFEFKRLGGSVVYGLTQILTNFSNVSEQVSGPIAIISVGAELARNDLANLFQFAAIVNINLAVVNTLPLPALDGGYLALLIVEALRGKKLPTEVEQAVMSSGFLLLLSLGVGLIIRDTINLF